MATFAELIYLCQDELKNVSDDRFFTNSHIKFLLGKYRAFLLKQRYADIKKAIPNSNYQTICIDLELTNNNAVCGEGEYLKSVQEIPFSLSIVNPKVAPIDFFGGEISYVNWSRFRNVGYNSFLKNFMYSTIGPDNHLYIKSSNSQYKYLYKVSITGIFEDIDKADELTCDSNGEKDCDEYNHNFPIEEALIPSMIQLVVQELTGSIYRPKDPINNANDDLSGISND